MPRPEEFRGHIWPRTKLPRDYATGHLLCNGRPVRCPIAMRSRSRPDSVYGPIVRGMSEVQLIDAGLHDLRDEDGKERALPATRGECPVVRPCPYLTCKYNMGVHLESDGKRMRMHRVWRGIFSNTTESMRVGHTCALDAAEAGGMTLEEVGQIMGVTRERIRQIELVALKKLRLRIEFPINLFTDRPSLGADYGDPRGRHRKIKNIGYTPDTPDESEPSRRVRLEVGEFFEMFERLEQENEVVKVKDLARMLDLFISQVQTRVHASRRLRFAGRATRPSFHLSSG